MTEQAALFPADQLVPQACPVGHCQAHRLAGQQGRLTTCAHDLDPERRRRPRGCLNAVDQNAPFPEGY